MPTSIDVPGVVKELSRRLSEESISRQLQLDANEFSRWKTGDKKDFSSEEIWLLRRSAYRYGIFDLLPQHGIAPVPYEIEARFELEAQPKGYASAHQIKPILRRPTKIAGFPVDYPLGLPASVLSANHKWIDFYARRGFDILTYKTVRTQPREAHRWPNWVFLKEESFHQPANLKYEFEKPFIGDLDYSPLNLSNISMANSFGVPSFHPDWWVADLRRARDVVREGHQVLIVSVMASTEGTDAIANDFVKAANLAKDAGADIIEANFSCPNVKGGESVGELYKDVDDSWYVAKALYDALEVSKTPLFIKIGYLPEPELRSLIKAVHPFIAGIVAINTISGRIVTPDGQQTFPDHKNVIRSTAGVSGAAIKPWAQHVVKNLLTIRKELGKTPDDFAILGLGGVLTPADASEYFEIGADAVESCTGAFLNPLLGLEIRQDIKETGRRRSTLAFELQALGAYLKETATNPKANFIIRANRDQRKVTVDKV